jgi:hypothetical protein
MSATNITYWRSAQSIRVMATIKILTDVVLCGLRVINVKFKIAAIIF